MRLACHDHPTKMFGRNNSTRRTTTPDHRATLDRYSSNLPGEPTRADGGGNCLSACIDHCRGVSMYSVRRVPAWPSTYPFPQGETHDLFKIFPFDRFVFALYHFARSHTPWCGLLLPPFTVSHDLTHLGRKVREHIPLKKNITCPGHTDRPILPHFLLISLRDARQEHSGPGSWKHTSELISLRDSPR